jgi:hypothetical protein
MVVVVPAPAPVPVRETSKNRKSVETQLAI